MAQHDFKRDIYTVLLSRLKEKRQFIQVISGPRQVGKTTVVSQLNIDLEQPVIYASADDPTLRSPLWIEQQWDLARLTLKKDPDLTSVILILDEIQKITEWSSTVKRLWDEDTKLNIALKLVLLGSAPLLIQRGLSESLAGRFEQLHATHWSYKEMHQAFGWDLETYLYFGGYPGSARLITDEHRWRSYINDSLIETILSRDILLLTQVNKPALLRRLFELGCHYSGQILSYQKMTGQLQDSGNTTTLAHYLELLGGAGMLTGIPKFSGQLVRQRGSSPKFQVLNTALLSACSRMTFSDAQQDRSFWGRLVESAVGAYLMDNALVHHMQVYYWRDHSKEVDFVVQWRNLLLAIEVKSGLPKTALPGMELFCKQFNPHRSLVIGSQTIPLETFLTTPLTEWFL